MTFCFHGSLISIRVDGGSVMHSFSFLSWVLIIFVCTVYMLLGRHKGMHSSSFIFFFKTIRFEKKIRLCKKLKRIKNSTSAIKTCRLSYIRQLRENFCKIINIFKI
jgi:hypothetical protein